MLARRWFWHVLGLAILWPWAMNAQLPFPTYYYSVVPNELLTVDGNTNSRVPFGVLGPVRYQQVYEASQFTNLPLGGAFLTVIQLRADCLSERSYWATNLQVNLSVTPKRPGELSSNFSQNTGPDDTTVFHSRWAPPAACLQSNEFDFAAPLRLTVPFFYDPAKGNLLLDFRSSGIDLAGGSLGKSLLDAQDLRGDSVSRAVAFSLTTDTAEVVDTVGLVTALFFYPTPSLTVRYETNNVILNWPTWPTTFRLQWSETVGPSAAWTDYPGPIEGNFFYQEVILPAASLPRPKFFRLYWNTPQPLAAPLATPPVQLDAVKTG